jgi:hypothetical protein
MMIIQVLHLTGGASHLYNLHGSSAPPAGELGRSAGWSLWCATPSGSGRAVDRFDRIRTLLRGLLHAHPKLNHNTG